VLDLQQQESSATGFSVIFQYVYFHVVLFVGLISVLWNKMNEWRKLTRVGHGLLLTDPTRPISSWTQHSWRRLSCPSFVGFSLKVSRGWTERAADVVEGVRRVSTAPRVRRETLSPSKISTGQRYSTTTAVRNRSVKLRLDYSESNLFPYGTAIKHPVRNRYLFVIFDIRTLWRSALRSECPDYKWRLNQVWHRML